MLSQIILRNIAGAALDFADLRDLARPYPDSSTNRQPIAPGAQKFEEHPMIAAIAVVQKQGGRFPDIQGHDVDAPIVVDIAESRTSPGVQWQISQAGLRRYFFKRPVALVTKQQDRLFEVRCIRNCVHLGIYVAVGRKNIQPAVVVHVEKSRAPSHVCVAGLRDLRVRS